MAADGTPPPPIILAGDPEIRTLLADLLSDEGHVVVIAADRAAAIALAQAGPARLVILDLDVPSAQGADFCRAYREHGGTAPIVLITGQAVDGATVAAYGADGYVAKPFDPDVVLELVARLTSPR